MTATHAEPDIVTSDSVVAGPSPRHALLIAFLVIASTVSWRPSTLYEGGTDPVVLAKAALSGLALGAALLARGAQLRPVPLSAMPIWLLTSFLATTMFGAYASGLMMVSAVIVVRVIILASVGYLFVRAFGFETAARCWLTAMASVAMLAAVTGLPTIASGRLRGGIPPIHPNELAIYCVFPALGLIWSFVNGRNKPWHNALLLALLVTLWATGSRTSLGAAVLGAVIIVASIRRPTPGRFVALVFAAATFLFIALGTDLLWNILLRGGRENLTGVASRSIGWSAALDYAENGWGQWAGVGIALREIPVQGQYWDTQLLDSSWISAYVQTGRLGVILLIVWICWIIWSVRLIPKPLRSLAVGTFAAVLLRSVTESGLVDSTVDFFTFWLLTLACATATARRWRHSPLSTRNRPES